jgi:hypothetical protein
MSTNISESGANRRRLARRAVAATIAVALTAGGLSFVGTTSASADTPPLAQSVGRFVDGSLGNSPIQKIADLKDARALAPGGQSVQNPLDANLLNGALDLPLTGALQLPELLGINLGAVNQVAVAHNDGYSYGASGAVNNSGGVSVGGDNNAFPANATIDLTAAGLTGNSPIPIPGGDTSADALGGLTVSVGAVSALAQTAAGVGQPGQASYNIASLTITLGSPLIGGILNTVGSALSSVLNTLSSQGSALGLSLPDTCSLTTGTLPDITLEGGAITIDPQTASITIDLEALLTQLGLGDLANGLAPNTDLIDYLLNYLTSPSGLAQGLTNVINGLAGDLADCAPTGLQTLLNTLLGAGSTLETTINGVVAKLASAVPGGDPLAPLGTLIKKLIDIGVNVQPNGPAGTFTSQLSASPDQATGAVAGQTVVRAIEVDVLGKTAVVALANAAAGPSSAAPATTSQGVAASSTNALPTGVPAGFDKQSGNPAMPLVLLLVGLLMAGGGALAWRVRGAHTR